MTTKEFIKKLDGSDMELIRGMEAAGSIKEAYLIARNEGVTDSEDVFFMTMNQFKKAVDEISADELETLVGNSSTSEIVSAVSTYTGAAAAAGAAAAV